MKGKTMIDFVVCDTDEESTETAHDACFDYCFRKNYDADVHSFEDVDEAQEYITEQSSRLTCILGCGEPVNGLIGDIRDRNSSSYVVLMAESIADLVKYTTPVVRPAGCLLKPVKDADVYAVIDSIAKDLDSSVDDAGVFCFRIRSKEYYVDCSRIIMFEAVAKKIVLYTAVQEYEFYASMAEVTEQLPEAFVRCHKSFVVNMDRIKEVDYKDMVVYMEDDLTAGLSRSMKSEFAGRLDEHRRKR